MRAFFLCQQFTGLDNILSGKTNSPEGMPAAWKTWLRYYQRGYDVRVFMIGEFTKETFVRFQGCSIYLLPRPEKSLFFAKTRLGTLIREISDNICLYLRAARVARKLRPVIVYSLRPNNAYAAWLLSKRYHCPCVKRIFGTVLYNDLFHSNGIWKKLACLRRIVSWLWPADMTIITNDGTQGNKVAQFLRIRKERYRFWFNGIDKTWTNLAHEAKSMRNNLGLSSNHFVLLCLSSLAPWKRQDRVVQAMELIVKDLPHARLVFAGDGTARTYLTKLVADIGLTPFVKFLGRVPYDKVQSVMGIADVFLQTNDYSCLGNSLLEAMVCGRAIVTWDVGATSKVIIDGETGCLLPDPEPATIAKAVISLAKDPQKAKHLGRGARGFVEENLQTWDKRLDMEIDLIEELCS